MSRGCGRWCRTVGVSLAMDVRWCPEGLGVCVARLVGVASESLESDSLDEWSLCDLLELRFPLPEASVLEVRLPARQWSMATTR